MKEKLNKIIYTDKKGNKWSDENIQDLIDGYAYLKGLAEILSHYSHRV